MIRSLGATSFLFLGITVIASGLGACAHGTTFGNGGNGGSDDSFPVTSTGVNEVTSAATAGQTNGVGATSTHAAAVTSNTSGPSQVAASSSSGATMTCGDGICNTQGGESCGSCPSDCSCCTLDGFCDMAAGETATNCAGDCATTGNCNDPCSVGPAQSVASCANSVYGTCVSSVCGGDGWCCGDMGGTWDSLCVDDAVNDVNCSCI